ncbi:MAG: lipid A biosynthesis acyltransferase [Nevskiaceae bacterium]
MTQSWDQQAERGTALALKLTLLCTRLLGRTLTRVIVLAPITAYFLLFAGSARRASRNYLRRALGREPRLADVARHFHALAAVTLDRMFLLRRGPQGFDVQIHRPPEVDALADRASGCLLVLAHLGGYEALRLGLSRRTRPLRILMDLAVGRKLMSLLTALNPDMAEQVIDASERGPGLVLKLREALEQGAFVGIMADRATAEERAIEADFFGDRARFAIGPWMLASGVGVPVILAFGLYRGGNRYDLHLELFSERIVLPRGSREEAVRAHVQHYASRLEHYARLAPYNWFNFYDYWAKPAAGATETATGPTANA